MIDNVKWLGHASVFIEYGDQNVYIDPWKLTEDRPVADLILITHNHYDHLSPEDIEKISDENTVIVGSAGCDEKVTLDKLVKPSDEFEIGDLKITAVPAYNKDKNYHPKENDWLGYLIEGKSGSYYHPGDTDFIEEMEEIECDVAFMVCGGTYTMNAEKAAEAANKMGVSTVVPIHWGDIIGSRDDAVELSEKFNGETVIMEHP